MLCATLGRLQSHFGGQFLLRSNTFQTLTGLVVNRKKAVVTGLVALATLVVANVGWTYYSSQREADAQVQLSHLISTFGDTKNIKSDKERYRQTIAEAQKIRDEYATFPAARLAQYYIAMSEENLGNTDKAVENLKQLIADADPTMKALAQFALGGIYKNHGDKEKAMEVYQQLNETGAYSKMESHSLNHPKEGHSGKPAVEAHH
jgi:predicted negative regulator of RcsB-dependent stress response